MDVAENIIDSTLVPARAADGGRHNQRDASRAKEDDMMKFLKSRDFLLVAGMGNFMLWLCFCFLILGGCAFGQDPYKLSKIGPFKWDFNNAHPVLWWINYVHTFTQIVSVPLMFLVILRMFKEDGEGVRDIRYRLKKRFLGNGKAEKKG